MKRLLLLSVIIAGALLIFTSCEKDEDDDPAYVGSWVRNYTMPISADTELAMKDVLTLGKSQFTQVSSLQHPLNSSWYEMGGAKGSMEVSGSEITVTFTATGEADIDMVTFTVSDFVWYEDGTSEFDTFITENFAGNKSVTGNYVIVGKELTLSIDEDGDGTIDTDEVTVFTKQ